MTIRIRAITWLLFLLFVVVLLGDGFLSSVHALGSNYRGPFKGRVVDQDTNEPIEGAVVFVEWHINHMMAGATFFDAKEVLTDKNGAFYIPANWSFNPWRNFVMDSKIIIFKAGYGYVDIKYGPGNFEMMAQELRSRSPEQLAAMGPGWYFDVHYEDRVPLFLLKKLSTKQEYGNNTPLFGSDVPLEKRKLLMEEMSREDEVFQMEEEHRK